VTIKEAVRASLKLLSRRDRRLLGLAVLLQVGLSFLDLLGVTMIGMVGAMALATVQNQKPPAIIMKVVDGLGMGQLSSGLLLTLLTGVAAVLLLAKNIISPLLISRVFLFLGTRQAMVSARLARELLSRPLTFVQLRSSQETAAALLQGPSSATVVILGQSLVLVSELALLIMLSLTVLLVDFKVALAAIVFFGLYGVGLQKVLGQRVSRVGDANVKAEIASYRTVQETLSAYREIAVSDRRSLYVDRIRELRSKTARGTALLQIYNVIPKYASEAALVVGAFSLGAVLFATRPPAVAAGTFALFLATATRVMPSLLRLASAALLIRGATGSAATTYELADDLGNPHDTPQDPGELRRDVERLTVMGYPDFNPRIDIRDMSFSYEGSTPVLCDIDLTVEQGQSLALVGRSGAGKSTLADILLGVLKPDSGTITVGGVGPAEAVQRWPGSIGYVPQEVMLVNDTIRANVALGLPRYAVDDELVWEALRRAHLEDYVRGEADGLDTQVGERGLRISGGQRQRVGIARALFTRPQLLVLDEATSALDAETEQSITAMLDELEEHVTTVIIAHRLSTIRHADIVMYLEDGVPLSRGTFDEVCAAVPALQKQAGLMGL